MTLVVSMIESLEVHNTEPRFDWVEILVRLEGQAEAMIVRLVVGDSAAVMTKNLLDRIKGRIGDHFALPESRRRAIDDLLEEAVMAHAMVRKEGSDAELAKLFPTNVVHFNRAEKTTFRKSGAVRIRMFLTEARQMLKQRNFDGCLQRLSLVHHLDPGNANAFQFEILCLRSARRTERCIQVFEEWNEAHPDDPVPRLGLGEMWLYLDQYARAKDVFESFIKDFGNDATALIGLAQSAAKLGLDPSNALRKASMIDREMVVEMVEHRFDFRARNPDDLMPMTLEQVAQEVQIPLKRVVERAQRGTLPLFPPEEPGDLPRVSRMDLERWYGALKLLGLEIDGASVYRGNTEDLVQGQLFDEG